MKRLLMKSFDILEASLISDIERCMRDYHLKLTDRVIVGLSGGKDSTTLVFLLNKMGFKVIPVIIDLGYKSAHAQSIAFYMSNCGFQARIVSAVDPDRISHLSHKARANVLSNLKFLASPNGVTPCGACSQTKRSLLIHEAERCSARWIVLGHHRDDFLATILKDYFVNLYYEEIGIYDAQRFSSFVPNTDIDLRKLECLVDLRLAATMAIRLRLSDRTELIRPMAYTTEADITKFVQISNTETFGSGCAHEVFTAANQEVPTTKREIIHADLRRRLRESPNLGNRMLVIALKSLDGQGRLRFNPRALRNQTLPGFEKEESRT